LGALRASGVRITLDNFGTGYSSLYHLRNFKLDNQDRSQLHSSQDNRPGQREHRSRWSGLVEALASPLPPRGIDGIEQATLLLGNGWNVGQGTLFRKPVDAQAALMLFPNRADELQVG
jgi:EAL domain-containing protein (putative c-di-GMP-specific phosphodiesterase class I)